MKTMNRRDVLGAVAVGVPTLTLAAALEKKASALSPRFATRATG